MDESVVTVTVRVLPDRRVARADAGKVLGRTPKTMAEWCSKGWGPRPIKVGGRVFHDYDECLAMARGEKPIKPPIAA
jgi:hypothetical protein